MERLGPVIATTACSTTSDQVRSARAAASAGADRVEVRLDALGEGERPEALLDLAREMPLLVSGSRTRVKPSEPALLLAAQARGALVDVPCCENLPEDLWGLRRDRLVLSFHDFEGTPEQLPAVLDRMRRFGAAWYKLVPTALDFPESAAVKTFLEGRAGRGDVCAFAMGLPGLPSRVMALAWGSAATYCAAPGSPAAAPGQLGLDECLAVFRVRSVSADEPLYGVVGWPLAFTGSPGLHNRWLEKLGLPGRFLQIPVRDTDAFFRAAGSMPLRGLAVTIPHKRAVLDHVRHTARLVKRLGACNTLIGREGGWIAANTDAFGIRRALRGLPRPCRSLVLGAGGASAAACAVVSRMGPAAVSSRSTGAAVELAARFSMEAVPWPGRRRVPWDLLVNATPVGQEGDASPFPYPLGGSAVFDMVVRDGGTSLLGSAVRSGLAAIPGSVMLEAQARLQFRLFTGQNSPGGNAHRPRVTP